MSCIVLLVAEVSDNIRNARVAQLVERDLAKVEAAGSSPVSRFYYAQKRYPMDTSFFCIFKPSIRETWRVILVSVSWHILYRITAHPRGAFISVGDSPLLH